MSWLLPNQSGPKRFSESPWAADLYAAPRGTSARDFSTPSPEGTAHESSAIEPAIAREKFLKRPFALKHGLADHPLFSLQRLVKLAKSLPRDRIEYNSGKVAVGAKPEEVPRSTCRPKT